MRHDTRSHSPQRLPTPGPGYGRGARALSPRNVQHLSAGICCHAVVAPATHAKQELAPVCFLGTSRATAAAYGGAVGCTCVGSPCHCVLCPVYQSNQYVLRASLRCTLCQGCVLRRDAPSSLQRVGPAAPHPHTCAPAPVNRATPRSRSTTSGPPCRPAASPQRPHGSIILAASAPRRSGSGSGSQLPAKSELSASASATALSLAA
jgi:hypothetical protein